MRLEEKIAKLIFEMEMHNNWDTLGDNGPYSLRLIYIRKAERVITLFEEEGWVSADKKAEAILERLTNPPAKRSQIQEAIDKCSY